MRLNVSVVAENWYWTLVFRVNCHMVKIVIIPLTTQILHHHMYGLSAFPPNTDTCICLPSLTCLFVSFLHPLITYTIALYLSRMSRNTSDIYISVPVTFYRLFYFLLSKFWPIAVSVSYIPKLWNGLCSVPKCSCRSNSPDPVPALWRISLSTAMQIAQAPNTPIWRIGGNGVGLRR